MADPLSRLILHAKQPLPPGSSCMRQDSQTSLQPGAANLEAMCFPAVAVLLFAQASSTGVNAQKAQQYMAAGRYQQSAEEWAQVTKADPTNARAWYSLGRAWVTLARVGSEDGLLVLPGFLEEADR